MQKLPAGEGTELLLEFFGEFAREREDKFFFFRVTAQVAFAESRHHAEAGKCAAGAAHASEPGAEGRGKAKRGFLAQAYLVSKSGKDGLGAIEALVEVMERFFICLHGGEHTPAFPFCQFRFFCSQWGRGGATISADMNIQRTLVKHALASEAPAEQILVEGWVRTRRDSKTFSFLEVNDGTSLASIQVVADAGIPGYEDIGRMTTGSSVSILGRLIESPGKQKWEIQATEIKLVGSAPETYPLQKKGHSPEFLRTIAHLRPRTNLFGAIFRTRSRMAAAVHQFFLDRDFVWVHTPIITASDCEGAGEMFRVTTMDPLAENKGYDNDFFGKPANLTVSGQLEGETFACALSNIYTFGPTFRAENSNTSRHAAEFWMIEPEIAFCDIYGDMDIAESFIKHIARTMLNDASGDFEFFCKFVDKGLRARLEEVAEKPFVRCSYTEAIEIMQASGEKFEYPPYWGMDMQSEHERFLTEKHFKCPVIVYNYPKEIKPFYMRLNEDGKTVTAMDVLVPGIGEIIGGSQREERLDILEGNIDRMGMDKEAYYWYNDLRRYGTVPHAGFGVGFERLIMFVTGVQNIRDVLPFPRTPRNCEF